MTVSTKPRGRILVVRGGAIGDFILTLPVLRALRDRFSTAELEVLGYPHIVQVAQSGGLVDRVSAIEARGMAGFFARNGTLDKTLSDYFSEFSMILSYLYDPDGIFRENVARCSEAQFVEGPHRPDETEAIHATDVLLKPLERFAIFDADPVPRLILGNRPPDEILDLAGAHAGVSLQWLAAHPGSGSEKKNWPEARWAGLLARLARETQLRFLLIGGEAEGDRLARLARILPVERVRVARSLPLSDLALLLRQCHVFLGHDSGISHLAGALGVRGLVLWNDTNPVIWKPRTELLNLLQAPGGLGGLSETVVFERMRELA